MYISGCSTVDWTLTLIYTCESKFKVIYTDCKKNKIETVL